MTECVIASGWRDRAGYARVWGRGGSTLAHRAAWEAAFGPIPDGLEVGHACHDEARAAGLCAGGDDCPHRACVELTHLTLQTRSENMRAAFGYRDGKCPEGHDLDLVGTTSRGRCRQCLRNQDKARYAADRARRRAQNRDRYNKNLDKERDRNRSRAARRVERGRTA